MSTVSLTSLILLQLRVPIAMTMLNVMQPISGDFSQNPNNQPQHTREGPSTYEPNKYPGASQPAICHIHPGSDYQPAATASAPQYHHQAQSRSENQPQHHSQPQPHKSPPQPVPGYELNRESATRSERQESHVQQGPQPAQEPNHKTGWKYRGQPGAHMQQRRPGYELNPHTAEEKPEPDTQQPDQPLLSPEDDQEEDEEDLQFQNHLQNQVNDETHQEDSEVIQQVSRGRRHI